MYSNQYLIELIETLRAEEAETEWLEFKANYVSGQSLGEYISALSNGAALCGRPYGYLVFGIEDGTHEVTGTKFDYRKEKQDNENLENWLNRLVEPRIEFSFYIIKYAALKNLVLLEIPAAYIQPTAFMGKRYVRIGSYKQDLSRYPETEKRLWNMLGKTSWEQSLSGVQNLHFKQLTLIADSRGIDFSERKFTSLRMTDTNGRFTNLAYLLSDENPHVVKFAVYKGPEMNFRVKKEFSGSWIAVLDQVLSYTDIFNDVSARVIGSDAVRTETQSYPDPSLREIVVNAFAHFDAAFPSDIKIEFYPDKAEIASPGPLYRISMSEVLNGRQSFRNPNLVFVLNKFNYIENYATGLKKTLAAYAGYSRKPRFNSTENFFVVTLPNMNYEGVPDGENIVNAQADDPVKSADDPVKPTDMENLSEDAAKILAAINRNPKITRRNLAVMIGKTLSTVRRRISELKDKGYIERIGSDKYGEWRILK